LPHIVSSCHCAALGNKQHCYQSINCRRILAVNTSCSGGWPVASSCCSPERQSAQMSKITNGGLTRSGTWCTHSCTHMATVGVKRLNIWWSCFV